MSKGKPTKKLGRKVINIFPDSSFLISYLDKKQRHNEHACACFRFLISLKASFYISTLVIMETMSGLVRNGYTVRKASEILTKFIDKEVGSYFEEKPIKVEKVYAKYANFARARKINKLTTVDFYIVTEAMALDAKLLTMDKRMYRTARKSYKEAYLITDKIRGLKSDLPRLCKSVIYNLK